MGTHSAPNPDCYAYTNRVLGNGCNNARAVDRKALESRVLTGLRERMMTPEIAAEAMRAYTHETNQLNRQRRSSSESTRRPAKAIAEIVRVIEQDGRHRRPARPADRTRGQTGRPQHPPRGRHSAAQRRLGLFICAKTHDTIRTMAHARKSHDHVSTNNAVSSADNDRGIGVDPLDPSAFGFTKVAYAVDETLELLSIGRTALYAAVKRGDLKRVKFGKKTLFYAADLAAFLARLRHLSESDESQVDHGPR